MHHKIHGVMFLCAYLATPPLMKSWSSVNGILRCKLRFIYTGQKAAVSTSKHSLAFETILYILWILNFIFIIRFELNIIHNKKNPKWNSIDTIAFQRYYLTCSVSESQYRQLFIREERKRKIQHIDFDKMALTHQKRRYTH